MIYLLILTASAAGIALLFLIRSVLRSRNVRRIVRAVRRGVSSFHERHAKLLPESAVKKTKHPPRSSVARLQQVRTLLHQAEKALARQDAGAAERTLIRALTLQEDAKEVNVQLAKLYLDTSRPHKAEALYQELLHDAQEPFLFANLGLACYKQGKFEEACEAYAAALHLDPRDPHRSSDLGRASMALRRFEDAALLFERALTSTPRNTELLHLLAECYTQLQAIEKAEEVYRRLNRLEPGNEEVKEKIAAFAGGTPTGP